METDSSCPICKKEFVSSDNVATLREKGANGVNVASQKRNDSLHVEPGQRVHTTCRRDYCSQNAIAAYFKTLSEKHDQGTSGNRATRSESTFTFSKDCLFCGNEVKSHSKAAKHFPVRTEVQFQDTIKSLCLQRNDELGKTILGRLEFAGDLHARDAVYHQACSTRFRFGKRLSESQTFPQESTKKRKGLHIPDSQRYEAFLKTVKHLRENDDEQATVQDLVSKMSELTDNPYSVKHMKRRLLEHMENEVFITESSGEKSFVTLKKKASDILQEFHRNYQSTDEESAKESIIKAAADLIKSDIKMVESNKDEYPDLNTISSLDTQVDFLPKSFRTMLESLIVGLDSSLKVAALGQAIMQGIRPRLLLCPLQLGLGVTMHHQYGSKLLVETLSKLGFACSYSEVKTFESSAASHHNERLIQKEEHHFLQFAADNVDHNLRTLDGYNTFHGMGSITLVTPYVKWEFRIPCIHVSAKGLAAMDKIKIRQYTSPNVYCPQVFNITPPIPVIDPSADLDILWKTSQLLRPKRPLWSGYMATAHADAPFKGKSSIVFLPLIDMDPTNVSCIFSTLHFVSQQCTTQNSPPVVTFDQPLYSKALSIITKEPAESPIKSIVLRLGGFHMMMSFLGSIGYAMTGTGFQEALETIYSSNTVPHIMSGKAFSRSLRANMLICSALHAVLMKNMLGTKEHGKPSDNYGDELLGPTTSGHISEVPSDREDSITSNENMDALRMSDLQKAAQLFDEVMVGTKKHQEIVGSQVSFPSGLFPSSSMAS